MPINSIDRYEEIEEFNEIEFLKKCRNDLTFHIREVQGVKTLEPYQEKIAKAISDNQFISIAACHDLGKTFTIARVILAIGSIYNGCKIITTAPTWDLVRLVLWSEINSGYRDSLTPLGGRMLLTEWHQDKEWFVVGLSPREEAGGASQSQGRASNFQGMHSKTMTVVVFDEATGVPHGRWKQVDGMMTSKNVKFIAIGNPTTKQCAFYTCFKDPSFHKIYLSCFDSPNLIANGIDSIEKLMFYVEKYKGLDSDEKRFQMLKEFKTVNDYLLTTQWVISRVAKWGIDHPLTQSKVLGRFPDEDEKALIHLHDIEKSQWREISETPKIRSIGVDPARFGSDSTVITVLDGKTQTHRVSVQKYDNVEIAGTVIQLVLSLPRREVERIAIDTTGIGSGVTDILKERSRDGTLPLSVEILECHFGSTDMSELDKSRFANLKAKIFVNLADDIKSELKLLNDSVYSEELPSILFKFNSKGQYYIESKDEYKKRTGLGSPDSADSLALANYGRTNTGGIGRFDESLVTSSIMASTIAGSMSGGNW